MIYVFTYCKIQRLISFLTFVILVAISLLSWSIRLVFNVVFVLLLVPLDVCLPKLESFRDLLKQVLIFFKFALVKYKTKNKMTPCNELMKSNTHFNIWQIILVWLYAINTHPTMSNIHVIPKIKNILKMVLQFVFVSFLEWKCQIYQLSYYWIEI